MRINPAGSGIFQSPLDTPALKMLLKLLAQKKVVSGLVKQVTSRSIVIQVARQEVEIPREMLKDVPDLQLQAGDPVELRQEDEELIVLMLPRVTESCGQENEPVAIAKLEGALLELDVPPTTEAELVAQTLLERGFALEKGVLWTLLPWAEQGLLDEALLLWRVGFPLTKELIGAARHLLDGGDRTVIVPEAKQEFSEQQQRSLGQPRLETRLAWSKEPLRGEITKVLARLFAQERLLETLYTLQSGAREQLFAVPFLRGEDLYPAWVRISDEQPASAQRESAGPAPLRLKLKIPTQAFGLLRVELFVQGKQLTGILKVEEPGAAERLESSLKEFAEELVHLGWRVNRLELAICDQAEG